MEPEVSITNTTSRGMWGLASLSRRRRRHHREQIDVGPRCSANRFAVGAVAGFAVHSSCKSRSAGTSPSASARATTVVPGRHDHGVIEAGDPLRREARREVDGDPHGIDLALARLQHRRRDATGIRHPIGIRGPAGARLRRRLVGIGGYLRDRPARDVAGAHHHREAQAVGAGVDVHAVLILDLQRDRLARPDIGDRGGEDVGPLALHQAGMLAVRRGLLIDGLGLLPLLDLADDLPVADLHHEMIDRRLLRQRKDIDALEPGVRWIDEALPHRRPQDGAGDGERDVGIDQRRLVVDAGLAGLEEQPALGGVVARLRRSARERKQQRADEHSRRSQEAADAQ
jgi:hypothetical protein